MALPFFFLLLIPPPPCLQGSACHSHEYSAEAKVSHVLAAMQVPLDWARGTVRLSVIPRPTHTQSPLAPTLSSSTVSKLNLCA
jgi:cysteine sulfinate desulfinase/cysteine desulfurase-like protein